jgi:hypothetical protein
MQLCPELHLLNKRVLIGAQAGQLLGQGRGPFRIAVVKSECVAYHAHAHGDGCTNRSGIGKFNVVQQGAYRLNIDARGFVKQAVVESLDGGAEHQTGSLNRGRTLKLPFQQALGGGLVALKQSHRMGQIVVKGFVSNRFKVGAGPFGLVALHRNTPRPVMEALVFGVLLGGSVKQHGKSAGISGDEAIEIIVDPRIQFVLFQRHGVVETEKSALRTVQPLLPVVEREAVKATEIVIVQHRSPNVSNEVLNLHPLGIYRPS